MIAQFRCVLIALCVLLLPPAVANAQPEPVATSTDAVRIAAARDKVLPVVVSILVVRQDYRQGAPSLSVASGSGTVVSAEGHIATNAHVTQNGISFRVVFADGRELPARLVGTDTLTDLAVLQAQPPKPETFHYAQFADSLDLKPGDTVLAMGAPWGLSNSMSLGVVNNPRRLLVSLFDDEAEYEDSLGDDEPTGRYYAWIQHDASIAPGNSGGPLVDLSGRIVGVNTRGMIVGGDLAFAIPGPDAGAVVQALIAKGRVDRVTLGFRLRSLKGTGYGHGVLVNSVERDSEPEKAGLQPGDLVLSLNGVAVDAPQPVDVPALQKRIAELPIDSKVVLQVERDGKRRQLALVAKAQPRDKGETGWFAPLGVSLAELTPAAKRRRQLDSGEGLMVTGVRPGGPAAIARPEIDSGAVLRAINGQAVSSLAQLQAAVTPADDGKPLVAEIEDDHEQRLSVVTPHFGDQARVPLPELPKAWVGVEVQPVTSSQARDFGLSSAGFRISRVYPGSPLAAAGARLGDLLVAVDGQPLKPTNENTTDAFDQRVHDLDLDAKARFEGLRAGKAVVFDVKVAPAPTETSGLRTLAVARLRAQLREIGYYDRVALNLPEGLKGVLLDGVEGGGPAGLAHLQRNDVVTRLGERDVDSPEALVRALEAALAAGDGLIPLQVIRGTQARVLYLDRFWLDAEAPESK